MLSEWCRERGNYPAEGAAGGLIWELALGLDFDILVGLGLSWSWGADTPREESGVPRGSQTQQSQEAHRPLGLERESHTSCDVAVKHLKLGLSQIVLGPVVTAA